MSIATPPPSNQQPQRPRQSAETTVCENCGCERLSEFVVADDNRFLVCEDCLLYQKQSPPPYEHYENQYHVHYASRREAKIRTGLTRLSALTRYLKVANPRMVDIGCSIGATVEAARRLGWIASGVDVSAAGVEYCCQQGLDCYKTEGLELPFDDETFDVVTSWHVIEHVEDVRETLREWTRVLKPGGLMMLETPDSQCLKARRLGTEYQHFWPMDHLYTFTRSNLCPFLERAGLEILPSPILGRKASLPMKMKLYAAGYRALRASYRKLGWCKSIEVVCRKA